MADLNAKTTILNIVEELSDELECTRLAAVELMLSTFVREGSEDLDDELREYKTKLEGLEVRL